MVLAGDVPALSVFAVRRLVPGRLARDARARIGQARHVGRVAKQASPLLVDATTVEPDASGPHGGLSLRVLS